MCVENEGYELSYSLQNLLKVFDQEFDYFKFIIPLLKKWVDKVLYVKLTILELIHHKARVQGYF